MEMLKKQKELQEAQIEKIKEIESLESELKVLDLQIEKLREEAIAGEVRQQAKEETKKWYAVFNGPLQGVYEEAEKSLREYEEQEITRKGK